MSWSASRSRQLYVGPRPKRLLRHSCRSYSQICGVRSRLDPLKFARPPRAPCIVCSVAGLTLRRHLASRIPSRTSSHIRVISSHQAIAELGGHRDRCINRPFQCSGNFFGGKGLFGESLQSEFLDGRPFPLDGVACFVNELPFAGCALKCHLSFALTVFDPG
jgi:hypothetical protein